MAVVAVLMLVASACDHTFTARLPNGEPVRWNPCQPIRFRINPEGLRPAQRQAVIDAMAAAGRAARLQVVYDGHTSSRNASDAVVVFAIAFTDNVNAGGYTELRQEGNFWVGGEIWINTLARLSDERTRDVAFHEVGHLFGLGHVSNARQTMWSPTPGDPYRSGDLAGLSAVGRRTGDCR